MKTIKILLLLILLVAIVWCGCQTPYSKAKIVIYRYLISSKNADHPGRYARVGLGDLDILEYRVLKTIRSGESRFMEYIYICDVILLEQGERKFYRIEFVVNNEKARNIFEVNRYFRR